MTIDLMKTQIVATGAAIPKKLSAFIWIFLKRHPWSLLTFSAFVIFEASLPSMNAYLLKIIIDGVISTANHLDLLLKAIILPSILYIVVQVFMNVIYTSYRYAFLMFYPKIKSDISGTMYHYLTQHSYRYFSEHFSGSLSKKIFDLYGGIEALMQISTALMFRFLGILISSVLLYTVHPYFGFIMFFWAVVFVISSYMMTKKSEGLSYTLGEAGNVASGKIVDSIMNIISTKLFTNTKHEEKDVFNSIDILMEKDRALQWYLLKIYCVQGIIIALLVVIMISVLIYGRLHNWVTAGDFALILTLSIAIAGNIFHMGEEILRFSKEAGNCRQALNIIVEPHEITDKPDAKELKVTSGKIIFDNVQFQHSGAEQLFKNKTVAIKPGQKIGLVGHSGGGKSTFVNLILRLYDVTSGRILIDGMDIKDVTQDSLRRNIGMIPQDPTLFHRSLSENIQIGKSDASYDEIVTAAKQAHAHEFIEQLPQKYDSLVGERGVKLSGGQRQRIAIARAFLKNAPILILDEATSQLDSVTERYIQESLWQLMQGKTTIVIAHRLSTLLHMDRILVFDKGVIVQDGKHEDLLKTEGLYKTLWNAQIGGFLLDSADD